MKLNCVKFLEFDNFKMKISMQISIYYSIKPLKSLLLMVHSESFQQSNYHILLNVSIKLY